MKLLQPITRRQNLDSSKLKKFADDNFKFDENGRKLSKRVENTVGKGEIARYEQFLLFPQCFQKGCFPRASKGVVVWEWVNLFPHDKVLDQTKLKVFADDNSNVTKMIISVFDRVENILENGEIACTGNLSFPQNVFYSIKDTSNFSFSHNVFKRLLSQTCQKVSLRGNGSITALVSAMFNFGMEIVMMICDNK